MSSSSFVRLLACLALLLVPHRVQAETRLRVGHFPNITHAQALIASQLSRQGKGWFETRLGPDVKIEFYVFNAGPSAMEALFAGSLDVTYVGPNPVLNGYARSQGDDVRVIAGATSGGAGLVVPGDGRLAKAADFRGKTIATPQLGNTQDVACRAWLKKQGYRVTQIGGDVRVLPVGNPDQLGLFQTGQVDAVWTVEPWVSRLELEAKGKLFLEQNDAIATVLAASAKFVQEQPALLKKFAAAHAELTQWITEHPAEAKELVRAELKQLTRKEISATLTDHAWARLTFQSAISRASFESLVKEAQSAGFLREISDLGRLVIVP